MLDRFSNLHIQDSLPAGQASTSYNSGSISINGLSVNRKICWRKIVPKDGKKFVFGRLSANETLRIRDHQSILRLIFNV
jgi:hypothetical protein